MFSLWGERAGSNETQQRIRMVGTYCVCWPGGQLEVPPLAAEVALVLVAVVGSRVVGSDVVGSEVVGLGVMGSEVVGADVVGADVVGLGV